jgi:Uma2 family endonuclease
MLDILSRAALVADFRRSGAYLRRSFHDVCGSLRCRLRYAVSMTARVRELATFADLQALAEDDVRAEVIHGAIVEKARASCEHGGAQWSFGAMLGRRFQRSPGGRWPGGWWFGSEIVVEYEAHEIYCHDLAGWRRDRISELTGCPSRIRSDWVCELLSPGDARRDLVDKFQVLHRHRVPHYWIADPLERWLCVHDWEPDGYLVAHAAGESDVVRAEPFEAVELRVATLFGIEDDEE